MYLKKKATVLISTVIILSLMSILGGFMFKMMKNNKELGSIYTFNKDIYDFDKNEEEILNEFMKELNKIRADKLSNQRKEGNDQEDIFSEDFQKKIKDSILEYHKNDGKLYLLISKDNEINRKREIKYDFRYEKILLVPTYKFYDNSK